MPAMRIGMGHSCTPCRQPESTAVPPVPAEGHAATASGSSRRQRRQRRPGSARASDAVRGRSRCGSQGRARTKGLRDDCRESGRAADARSARPGRRQQPLSSASHVQANAWRLTARVHGCLPHGLFQVRAAVWARRRIGDLRGRLWVGQPSATSRLARSLE